MATSNTSVKTVVTLIAIGSICWLVAGAVALVISAPTKVIWTCVVGALLGVVGIRYSLNRARKTGI